MTLGGLMIVRSGSGGIQYMFRVLELCQLLAEMLSLISIALQVKTFRLLS